MSQDSVGRKNKKDREKEAKENEEEDGKRFFLSFLMSRRRLSVLGARPDTY